MSIFCRFGLHRWRKVLRARLRFACTCGTQTWLESRDMGEFDHVGFTCKRCRKQYRFPWT